jgi:hypothetical protein
MMGALRPAPSSAIVGAKSAALSQRRVLVAQSSSRTSRRLGLTSLMDSDRISGQWLKALLTL